jgi:hypothetical protein
MYNIKENDMFKKKEEIDVKTVKDLREFLNNLDESYDDLPIIVNIFEGGWAENFGLGKAWVEGGYILPKEDFDQLPDDRKAFVIESPNYIVDF